jgi:transposase
LSGDNVTSDPVVIAVDPHKASWTAAAVDSALRPLAHDQGAGQRRGLSAAAPFRRPLAHGGMGHRGRLTDAGIAAVDVPAKLATRVRMPSTGHGRKNDDADALSVGITAHSAAGLRRANVEDAITALRALVEHRDDVVHTRTQTVNGCMYC